MLSIPEIQINIHNDSTHLIVNSASEPFASMILAHGAGAGMHHPFMEELANKLSSNGINVIRFNFLYMDQKKIRPDRPDKTIAVFEAIHRWTLTQDVALPVFVGGKSFGGRMASHWVHQKRPDGIPGIIFYGFPLHSPAKLGINRANHLYEMTDVPLLFLQGSKDSLAQPDLLNQVLAKLPDSKKIVYDDADHSFKRPKRSGKTLDDTLDELVLDSVNWIKAMIKSSAR